MRFFVFSLVILIIVAFWDVISKPLLWFFGFLEREAKTKDTDFEDYDRMVNYSGRPEVTHQPPPAPSKPLPMPNKAIKDTSNNIPNHKDSVYGQAVRRFNPNHKINEEVDFVETFAWEID